MGRPCLKKPTNKRKALRLTGLKSTLSFVLVCLPLLVPVSSGTARIILASLSVWEAALSTSVTLSARLGGKKKICSTEAVIPRLLIPGVGYNKSLPPSYPHACSLPLTSMLFVFHGLFFFSPLLIALSLYLLCLLDSTLSSGHKRFQ